MAYLQWHTYNGIPTMASLAWQVELLIERGRAVLDHLLDNLTENANKIGSLHDEVPLPLTILPYLPYLQS